MKSLLRFGLLFLFVSSFFVACEPEVDETAYERGDIVSQTSLQTITPNLLGQLLGAIGVEGIVPQYSVEYVKIKYITISPQGEKVMASGALFIPIMQGESPMVSFQHGTQTKRSQVASQMTLVNVESITAEGLAGAILASKGYIVSMADYLGLGASDILHPYLHAASTASAVTDFLTASKKYCDQNMNSYTKDLYLGGYSEGGYATLAVQKEIEENHSQEYDLRASAPMAGPYNLAGSVQQIFANSTYDVPANAAFLALAYSKIYSMGSVSDIFGPDYSGKIETLFNGTKTATEINVELTTDLNSLFSSNFRVNQIADPTSAFNAALTENTLLDWTPTTPMRFVHGGADEIVPTLNMTMAAQTFANNGATNIETITIDGATHETAAIPAVLQMILWFDAVRATQ